MFGMKKAPWIVGAIAIVVCLLIAWNACTGYVAARLITRRYENLEPGELWETTVSSAEHEPSAGGVSDMREAVVSHWADRALPQDAPGWKLKVVPPRIVLARLAAGRGVEAANHFLMQMEPWNASGSEWDVREAWGWDKFYDDRIRIGHRGDYDFTQSVLVTILYCFGDQPDRLYPETLEHLVNELLVDRGGSPRQHAPRSMGLVPETENHLLMTESARYLINQWLRNHGAMEPQYDNTRNGLGEWLSHLLENILEGGFYEFNSIPYQGYALQPLMNLDAYAECSKISGLSRSILDAELWRYAFSSLSFRRCPPFRRNLRNAGDSDLTNDRMTHLAAVWTLDSFNDCPQPLRKRLLSSAFSIDAALAGYRPPKSLVSFIVEREQKEFFVRMGRGKRSSPELYSAGPEYLLSAGGAAPPRSIGIAVRPILLLLTDGRYNQEECIRIPIGNACPVGLNRTGVYHRLAVGNTPVQVPESFDSETGAGLWRIYRPLPDGDLRVAVYNEDEFGLIALFPSYIGMSEKLLDELEAANTGADLTESFVFPDTGTRVEYDVWASPDTWVVKSVDGVLLPRKFADWPRLTRF